MTGEEHGLPQGLKSIVFASFEVRAEEAVEKLCTERESNTAGAKAQWIKCGSFRDAEASLPLLKQGAPTGRTIGMTAMNLIKLTESGEMAHSTGIYLRGLRGTLQLV